MDKLWPDFRIAERGADRVTWRGVLAPLGRRYEVSISYGLPRTRSLTEWVERSLHGMPESDLCRLFPITRVLSPRLRLRPDAVDESPLPHVYPNPQVPHLSPLCLFDPARNEWTHDDLIAETTVPWTADWIALYEAWLATGRWHASGRPARTVLHAQ